MSFNPRTAMDSKASLALMKFLSDLTKQLGVGQHVYVVGGAVRNFVIDQPIKDIDVVIDSVALKGKDSEWFAQQVARNIPAQTKITTNQYGVALLHIVGDWMLGGANLKGEDIEIANARKESYTDGGYKPGEVEPATIRDDVVRREFTFNTLMWRLHDLAEGPDQAEILDLTGCGLRDLQEGVMRCPSSPDKTFTDDPSRMIRAIKFLIKYGFKLSLEVERSIQKNKDKLKNIPHAHLSNMLINTFLREPTGKKALLEMQRLGLLDVIREIARAEKPFREALANWADKEAKVTFLFDLMDLALPAGRRLQFLTPEQREQVRAVTVTMSHQEAEKYLQVLTQPGKLLDTQALMTEFNLQGSDARMIQDVARQVLVRWPELLDNPAVFTAKVRMGLQPQVRLGKTFELNVGDPVLHGKFLNKPGVIKDFGKNDKGDPTVVIEPPSGGQGKEVKLFKVRYDEKRAPVVAAISQCRYTGEPGEAHPRCPVPDGVRHRVLRRSLGTVAGHQVWLVDGSVLRDAVDIDFTNGGNPAVYGYVPEDEVWVEDFKGPRKDVACTLLHEVIEMTLMQQGITYNDAHTHASIVENHYRMQTWDVTEEEVVPLVKRLLWHWASPETGAPRTARRKLANPALPGEYHKALTEYREEVTKAKRLLLTHSSTLWLAWYMFYKAGREWAAYVIDHLALPAKAAKPVEMAVRLFSKTYPRGKSPPDLVKWFEDNEARLELLDQARAWSERSEESGIFTAGPFTVHDTIQANPKDLDNAKDIIDRAVRAAHGSGVPGFGQMAYGQLFLVGQLGRKNWAAWYMPAKDAIYLRPGVRGSSNEESARHLVHELGHRFWAKKLDRQVKGEWLAHHTLMTVHRPDRRLPAVGEVLATIVNNKKVKVDSYDEKGSAVLVEATTGAPVGKVDRFQLSGWMQEADHRGKFPSLYAATDAEEHFCEALSLYAQGRLTGDNLVAFEKIVLKVDSAAVARIAARVAGAARPGSQGQKMVTQGRFEVWYLPKYEAGLDVVLRGLSAAERLYDHAQYRLPDKIPVVMAARAWGSQRSIYTTADGGFIQLVPAAFADKGNFATFVHELAHYFHSHAVRGGFTNGAIRGRFREVSAEKVEESGGSVVDQAQDALKEIEKEFPQVVKSVRPGMMLDLILPKGFGFNAPKALRPVRVVEKKGRGDRVQIIVEYLDRTPEEITNGIKGDTLGLRYFVEAANNPALKALLDDIMTRQSRAIEVYNSAVTSKSDADGSARYENHRSKWFPTDYAKTNPLEWFAELVTARLLAPTKMDPEVQAWLDQVAKTGSGPDTQWTRLTRQAAKYQDKKTVKTQDGDEAVVYEYSERQVQNRNREKAERVEKLRGNLHKLQSQVTKDLKSEDDHTRLCALAVGLMNDTYERVGNEESAKDGHVGVTGWTPDHVKFGDGKATFTYVGKSGVKQEKVTKDADLIRVLKEAVKDKEKGDTLFTYEGGKVDASAVNEYLDKLDLGITAKDIRGLHANREMQERLKAVRSKGGKLPEDKKEREKTLKDEFKEALEGAAEAVGHEPSTLKSQYLVPGLEDAYLKDGTVLDKLHGKKGTVMRLSAREDQVARRVAARYLASRHIEAGFLDWLSWIVKPFKVILQHHKDFIYGPVDDAVDAIIKELAPRLVKAVREQEVDDAVDQFQAGATLGWEDATEGRPANIRRVTEDAQEGGYAWGYTHAADWDGRQLPDVLRRQVIKDALAEFSHRITEEVVLTLLKKVWHAINPLNTAKEILAAVKKHGWKLGVGIALFELFEHFALPSILVALTGSKEFLATATLPIGEIIYAVVLKVVGRTPKEVDQADEQGHLDWYEREFGPVRLATKTPAQKEDKDVRQMLKPDPKKKPPREDLRRNRMRTEDDDLSDEGGNDLSLNYKKVAEVVAERWVRHLMAADPPPSPKPKDPKRQPGKVWKSDEGDGWVGMNKDEATHTFEKKEQAEAFAKGKSPEEAKGAPSGEGESEGDKPKGDKPKKPSADTLKRRKDVDKALTGALDKLPKAQAAALREQFGGVEDDPEKTEAEEKVKAAEKALAAAKKKIQPQVDELEQQIAARQGVDNQAAAKLVDQLDALRQPLRPLQEAVDAAETELEKIQEATTAKKTTFVNAVADALEDAEAAEKEALAGKPVTKAMMERASGDPFKKVNMSDPAAVAQALARQRVTEEVLLNPAKLGGKELSAEPLEPKALTARSLAALEQFQHGKAEMRKKAAQKAVDELAALDPDSPQAKELNRIIDGIHAAMEANGEKWDIQGEDGKLIREPLDAKQGLLFKQMLHMGKAHLLLGDPSDFKAQRDGVRDALGHLDDAQLQELAKDTAMAPIADLLGPLSTLAPDVQDLLRDLLRDANLNNMTVNRGLINAVAGKKMPSSNPLEAVAEIEKEFNRPEPRKEVKSIIDCLIEARGDPKATEKCIEGKSIDDWKEAAEEYKKSDFARMNARLDEMAKDGGVDESDPRIARVRHVGQTGDFTILDAPLEPAKTPAEEKTDWLKTVRDPEERKRIQEMSPDEFQAMVAAILDEDDLEGMAKLGSARKFR